MSEPYSAYQDLMTALVTRRADQSAAEDDRIVREALAKHAHELAEMIRKQTARRNLIRPEFEQAWEAGLHRGADVITPRDDDSEGPVGGEEKTP